jgi:hypothetical protein
MVAKSPVAQLTRSAFEQFALLPEPCARRLQFIDGESIEVLSDNISSAIGAYMLVKT